MRRIGQLSGFAQQTSVDDVDQIKLIKPKNKKGKQRLPEKHELLKKDLLQFGNNSMKPITNDFRLALAKAFHTFKLPVRPKMLHLLDMFNKNELDIWNKLPGLPWRDIGFKTRGEICKDIPAKSAARKFWHRIKLNEDLLPPDCLVYIPSDIMNMDNAKSDFEVVWEYPATMTFGEGVFAIPYMEAFKEYFNQIVYDYGSAIQDKRKIADRFKSYSNYAIINFEDFNKTTPAWLIEHAFAILTYNLDFVHYANYGIPNTQCMYRMYDYIQNYFINTVIRTADGEVFKKYSGIPNDSLFAPLIKSVINYILCQWVCIDQTGFFAEDILVHGDKSLIATKSILNPYKSNNLLNSIGININKKKSQITKEFHTLKLELIE